MRDTIDMARETGACEVGMSNTNTGGPAVGKGITLGFFTKPIESNITFTTSAGKEVMRIDKNGVKINPDFSLDEAAQHVINALDSYIKGLVQAEREACAKVCYELPWKDMDHTPSNLAFAAAIRARSNK